MTCDFEETEEELMELERHIDSCWSLVDPENIQCYVCRSQVSDLKRYRNKMFKYSDNNNIYKFIGLYQNYSGEYYVLQNISNKELSYLSNVGNIEDYGMEDYNEQ